jgi:hypothetical protein
MTGAKCLNAGDQIAAVSVAAVRGRRLLIGQIYGGNGSSIA